MVLKVVIQQSTFNITYTFACVQIRHNPLSGGYCGEVPPLPIPNREVKLTCADGTAMQCGRSTGAFAEVNILDRCYYKGISNNQIIIVIMDI